MLANLCHYESIIDGTLSLEDIAILNELIDVRAENERRTRGESSGYQQVIPPR